MILEVSFKNNVGDIKDFQWELYNRRYVNAFIEVTKTWLESRPNNLPTYSEKWFISSTQEDFDELLTKIKTHVETIDSLGSVHIGSSQINSEITREELNRLHEEFHKYVERVDVDYNDPAVSKTAALCHKLNDLVHLTEIAWMNKDGQGDCRVIATAEPHLHVPYEEEDYNYFSATPVAGELYAGYATPGKNLYHCYCDDDLPVIEKKLVRQSQGISPELHFEISGKESIDKHNELAVLQGYYEWCEVNKVKSYGYDYTKPEYRPGKLPLGKIINNLTEFKSFIGNKQGKIMNVKFI